MGKSQRSPPKKPSPKLPPTAVPTSIPSRVPPPPSVSSASPVASGSNPPASLVASPVASGSSAIPPASPVVSTAATLGPPITGSVTAPVFVVETNVAASSATNSKIPEPGSKAQLLDIDSSSPVDSASPILKSPWVDVVKGPSSKNCPRKKKSSGHAKSKGKSQWITDVVEPNTEFLSSSIPNEGAAIDLGSVAVIDASKNVDVVHYSEAKELPSSDTNVMATPAKVFSIITTSASVVQSSANSFRIASSSNKFAVLDLASDVVLPDDSEGDFSSGSDDSDEDLILNLKSSFSEKYLHDRPLQLPIKAINMGRGGRGGGRRGRGNRGRRGGFG
ncbi:unnamed protein product [Arabidopsis arenosa]|uniref:Uncharacterized protein n=1 Tax=Arabidopsis arenosa TaxID=38785 RepID=A0A8S2ANC3_ARAAE|nr:unnamed protein product [Arabidopsis arenosa]